VSASAAGDDGGVEPSTAAITQSAVVVPVPETEPTVGRHRARLDGAAAAGVPAHVTILYPFVPPDAITEETVAGLVRAVGSIAAFDCTFRRTAWFEDRVLYLAPEPDGPFRALTDAVTTAFPGYLPYGGAFSGVVPHLTVGDLPEGITDALRAAEAEVRLALPLSARIGQAWLMTGGTAPGSWRQVAALPLRTPG
jgi:hypothetical protein